MNLHFGDHSELVGTVDFDYDAIDRNLAPQRAEINEDGFEVAGGAIKSLMRWIWQDGKRNPEGLQIRAAIVAWVMLPELEELTETDLARAFGKHKQSYGRWVQQWKLDFPGIQNAHMKKSFVTKW
jgi:hypothetical protein